MVCPRLLVSNLIVLPPLIPFPTIPIEINVGISLDWQLAARQIGRNGNVHKFWIGQHQTVHQRDIFLARSIGQTRVVALFLAYARNRLALVVVGGVDQGIVGQCEQLVDD